METLVLVLPVARIAVRVPGSTVVKSVILFIPLPFVTTAFFTGIGFRSTTILPSFVARGPAVFELPAWGRPRSTLINLTTGLRGARAFTAIGRAFRTMSFTVLAVAVITTFFSAIVIGATISISGNSDSMATKILSIEVPCSTISILAGLVLQDAFTDVVTVYVSERNNSSSLATEVLEILPTGVPRNPRHDNAKAGWSSSPNRAVGVIGVPFRSALLSKLDNDVGAHETLSVESIQCILGIATVFELNKPKASHDTNINNTPIAVEKFSDVVRASIHRQTTKIQSAGHG